MTKRNILPVIFLLVLLSSCAPAPEGDASPLPELTPPAVEALIPRTTPPAPETPAPESPSPEPVDPIAQAVAAMTTEEKVGQLLVAGIEGTTPGEDARQAIEELHVGGVILFSRNVESAPQLYTLTNSLKALAGDGVPLLLCVDEEGGAVSRMPGELSDLPSAYVYGQAGDEERCYDLGQALAAQCAAFGFSMDFAPVLDVWSNPRNTVIGKRAFSSEAETAARLGSLAARGLMDGGVIPVGKHFPGHGDTVTDSHVGLPVVEKDVEALWDAELLPFRTAIEDGLPAVMVGHILMKALDGERPASLSGAVVTDLLRGALGFDGVVVTDDLTMAAVTDTYGVGEAAVLAFEAGCDLLLVCHGAKNVRAAHAALLAAVAEGRISSARLDESVYRLLSLKDRFGVTSEAISPPDLDALNAAIALAQP